MSARPDFSFEMPGELPLDDALAPFAEEVRFAGSGPPPVPSPALATVLRAGFSHPTDKGDLLVTAASNVHGPARQAAGLPNWKEEKPPMPETGFLAAVLAKLGCAGTAAKAAIAGATAVATMGLAGGAAGMLPDPAQHLVAAAVNATTPFEFPDGDVTGVIERAVPALPVEVTVPTTIAVAQPSASVTAGAKAGSTSASASAKTNAAATTPTAPNVSVPPIPQVTVPPAVTNLVNGLPACVRNLIPTGGAAPDPTKLAAEIPACIPQILAAANLPPQIAQCVASVLGAVGGASGMPASSVPSIGSLSMSSCVPVDATKCVSSVLSLLSTIPGFTGGSIPFVGSLGSLPDLTAVTGCVPMDVTKCITSMIAGSTGAVSGGVVSGAGLPKLDLSACMPTGLPTGGLPTGSLPNLGSLAGLASAIPFFGG